MRVDELLDFLRVDVLAAADNHIFKSARDFIVSVLGSTRKVARMKPTVLIDCRRCRLGHFVVTLHNVVTTRDEFARYLVGTVLARFGIDYLALDFGHSPADRRNSYFERIVGRAHSAAGRSLGLTVNYNDFTHIHFFNDVLHRRNRAGASRHDTRSHIRKIGFREIGMFEHRYKHCRHAVESRDMLVVNTRERRFRRKIRHGQKRSAVSHGRGHGKNHSETMEHRHLNHHSVSR